MNTDIKTAQALAQQFLNAEFRRHGTRADLFQAGPALVLTAGIINDAEFEDFGAKVSHYGSGRASVELGGFQIEDWTAGGSIHVTAYGTRAQFSADTPLVVIGAYIKALVDEFE